MQLEESQLVSQAVTWERALTSLSVESQLTSQAAMQELVPMLQSAEPSLATLEPVSFPEPWFANLPAWTVVWQGVAPGPD